MADPQARVELQRKELELLCRRANDGEYDARANLVAWMERNPEVWRQVGDAGARTELVLRRALAQDDVFQVECLRRDAEKLRTSLLPSAATPLETMVVQAVVLCWLGLNLAQQRLAAQPGPRTSYERAVASAQKLFSKAFQDLLLLQKSLGRPDCAVAIGKILRSIMATGPTLDSNSDPDILRFHHDVGATPAGPGAAANAARD